MMILGLYGAVTHCCLSSSTFLEWSFSTALYMLFVLTAGFAKVLNPEIESQPDRELFLGIDGNVIAEYPPMLRMGEVVGESYPQAAIGNF